MVENNYHHIALIPAFKPINEIKTIVTKLHAHQYAVVVVNDGSPQEYDTVFAQLSGKAGQHKPDDVIRITAEAEKHPDDLILGSRKLREDAPFKSRIGNTITNRLYRLTTKTTLNDTQTGLRAFSDRNIQKVLQSGGAKYEYEMYMLLNFSKTGNIREVPIEAIYANGKNATTHFRAIKDSLRIYRVFFRYMRCGSIEEFNQG